MLSAGAFGSPQPLMCSGIGPAAHLAEMGITVLAHDGSGANLHDHIDYVASFGNPPEGADWRVGMAPRIPAPRSNTTASALECFALLLAESGGFDGVEPALPAPDIQFPTSSRRSWSTRGRESVSRLLWLFFDPCLRAAPFVPGHARLASKGPAAAPADRPRLTAPADIECCGRRAAGHWLGARAHCSIQFGPTCRETVDLDDAARSTP